MALTLQVRPLPLLKRKGAFLFRALGLTVRTSLPASGQHCVVREDEELGVLDPDLGELSGGEDLFRILVRESETARRITLRVAYGEETAEASLLLVPARRWTAYLALHSHTDLGFTAPVSTVAQIHNRNTDRAIELCRATSRYAEGERFKWTCEVTWQVQNYLRDRSDRHVNMLMGLVRQGAIEIGGLYAGEHTDILGDEESVRSLAYAGHLRRKFGVPIETVLLSDVPGCTAGFVQIMAKSGIRNFLLADNNFIAPFLRRTDIPRPFRWLGADSSSVLCWYTDHPYYAYIEGELYGFTRSADAVLAALPDKLLALESAGFPYSSLQIQYAFDNAELDPRPAEVAREWNRQWEWPRVRIATPRDFFNALRAETNGEIPTRQGDWTSWWSSIATGFPVESAITRDLHDRLPALETLGTLVSLHDPSLPESTEEIAACYDGLLAFDEHSGGGGVWKPSSEDEQARALREGFGFLYEAKEAIERLEREADEGLRKLLSDISPGGGDAVLNLLPWPRSGVVRLPSSGREAFVQNVPAYGFRIVEATEAGEFSVPGGPAVQVGERGSSLRIENQFYRILIDPTAGVILSLFDLRQDREMIRPSGPAWGLPILYRAIPPRPIELGKFIPEIFDGTPGRGEILCLRDRCSISCKASHSTSGGAECVISWIVEGVEWCTTRVFLEPAGETAGLETRIRRTVLEIPAVRGAFPELVDRESHLYLPLAFELPGSRIRYESPGLTLTPPEGQLTGSCRDFYAVQHWILLASETACVAAASPDAPLIDIGSPGALRFKTELDADRSLLYVRLASMHELGTQRESPYSRSEDLFFRFAVRTFPAAGSTTDHIRKARQTGWEIQNPLRTISLPGEGHHGVTRGQLVTLEPDHVQIVTLKRPAAGVGVILRVIERHGLAAEARFTIPGWNIIEAHRTDLMEEVLEDLAPLDGVLRFTIAANGIETFHLLLERGGAS